jgi:hypothetical protein
MVGVHDRQQQRSSRFLKQPSRSLHTARSFFKIRITMVSSLFVVLALAASSLASIYTTSPTANTTFTGGQQSTVSWIDDGKKPSLSDFGNCMVSIYVGNAMQQTQLQLITPSVNVATTSTIQFVPNPSIGPNSNEYFIRFQSLALMDPTQPQYPALAFSAKFSMTGMTGTFNSSVQAQIDGQSTAPIGGPTSSASGASQAPATTTPNTASKSGSASASAAKSTASSGAGSSVKVPCFTILAGVVALFGMSL